MLTNHKLSTVNSQDCFLILRTLFRALESVYLPNGLQKTWLKGCPPDAGFFCFMKFTILINQKAAIESELDLDIIDLSIFDFIKDFTHSGNCKSKLLNNKIYYLLSWKLISSQLPILFLRTRQSVYSRMKKLCDRKILESCPDNQTDGEAWYCFSTNYDYFVFKTDDKKKPLDNCYPPVNETLQGCNSELSPPVNETLQNNTISNNTISNKVGQLPPNPIEIVRNNKIEFCKAILAFDKKYPNKYPKLMYLAFAKYWTETGGVRKIKMRFEDQKFFEISRRLATWFSKAKDPEITSFWEKEQKIQPLNELLKTIF